MSNKIIIHGEKSTQDGGLHPAHKARLDEALKLIKNGDFDTIIVTGADNRSGLGRRTEVQLAEDYLQGKLPENVRILREDFSRTTVDNVYHVFKMYGYILKETEEISAIFSKTKIWRLKRAYNNICPELKDKLTIIGLDDPIDWQSKVMEPVFRLIAICDPLEKSWFTQWLIKVARNG